MGGARNEGQPETACAAYWRAAPDGELSELLGSGEAFLAAVDEAIRTSREILTAGDARDASADARDHVASRRDQARDLTVLLDVSSDYGVDWPERRAATLDRERAKQDRIAARLDRWALADQIRRLIQAGGRGLQQGALLSLGSSPDGEPARRQKVRSRTPQAAGSVAVAQMQLTGAVWIDGVEQPISLDAASWEQAIAQLNHLHGRDREFVLTTEWR